MAITASPSLSLFTLPSLPFRRTTPPYSVAAATPIRCGPRGNRCKLLRGRTLSTEAILAIQALKRASSAGDETRVDRIVSTDLTRLIKADLLAAVAELQRQNQWSLAFKAFAAARREPWYKADLALHAEMVSTLARCRVPEVIDVLVGELLEEKKKDGGFSPEDDVKGIARLVRALMAAERGKLVKDVYREMRRGGCEADEFLFKFLIRGLRRLGEGEAADEVARDYEAWFNGGSVTTEPVPV